MNEPQRGGAWHKPDLYRLPFRFKPL
jgi:hypothetical protein